MSGAASSLPEPGAPRGAPGSPRLRLAARNVTKRFAGLMALDNVSVEVEQGEVVGLIGPNGSGKTTLLNVISGALSPTAGTIALNGRRWSSIAPNAAAKLGIRRTFQNIRLFAEMTALETAEVAAAALGSHGSDRREQALDALALVGLEPVRDRMAETLAYGLQRRLEIARAVAGRPPAFLLLDEPAAGLNRKESDQLVETILHIRDRFGCGIVLIDHDLRVIMSACSRIAVLDHGRLISEGDPETVRNDPAVIEAYLG